jgi:rRNA processing protein Gar1
MNIIVKSETIPKIGQTVVDENLKVVGKVFDIIGPTSSPYVTVKPCIQGYEKLVNKKLYVLPSKRRRN